MEQFGVEQKFVQPGWITRATFVVFALIASSFLVAGALVDNTAAVLFWGIGAVTGVTGALFAEVTVIGGAPARLRCWQRLLLFRWGYREVSPEDIISIECGPIRHAGPTELIEFLWWPFWMLVRKRYQVHCLVAGGPLLHLELRKTWTRAAAERLRSAIVERLGVSSTAS